ncbi:MAG: hypothetical protein KDD01_19600 [Phaeodactylibacter sp.]|nr:hypothetical protein [Phaeodactylibacter sp.]
MLGAEAALVLQIDQYLQPAFSLLRLFRPLLKQEYHSEKQDKKEKQDAVDFFD